MEPEESVKELMDYISTVMFLVWLTSALCVFGLVTTLLFFVRGLL